MPMDSPRFAVKNLGYAGPCSDEFLQVSAREPLLVHTEFDCLNRIGRVHRIVLRLIGVDEGRKHIEPVAIARSRLSAPQAVDLLERSFIVPLRSNRLHLSAHAPPRSRRSCRSPCVCQSTW